MCICYILKGILVCAIIYLTRNKQAFMQVFDQIFYCLTFSFLCKQGSPDPLVYKCILTRHDKIVTADTTTPDNRLIIRFNSCLHLNSQIAYNYCSCNFSVLDKCNSYH